MISKNLQILGLLPQTSKVFPRSLEQFFLTVGQNNFGNKIPFHLSNDSQNEYQNISQIVQCTRLQVKENSMTQINPPTLNGLDTDLFVFPMVVWRCKNGRPWFFPPPPWSFQKN